jgi:hypothetical protein
MGVYESKGFNVLRRKVGTNTVCACVVRSTEGKNGMWREGHRFEDLSVEGGMLLK